MERESAGVSPISPNSATFESDWTRRRPTFPLDLSLPRRVWRHWLTDSLPLFFMLVLVPLPVWLVCVQLLLCWIMCRRLARLPFPLSPPLLLDGERREHGVLRLHFHRIVHSTSNIHRGDIGGAKEKHLHYQKDPPLTKHTHKRAARTGIQFSSHSIDMMCLMDERRTKEMHLQMDAHRLSWYSLFPFDFLAIFRSHHTALLLSLSLVHSFIFTNTEDKLYE